MWRRRFPGGSHLSDKDTEQAYVRVLIGIGAMIYLAHAKAFFDSLGRLDQSVSFMFLLGFYLYAVLMLTSTFLQPGPSVWRRIAGIVTDLFSTTYGLWVTGAIGAPLAMIYLWVTIGNGVRFGAFYMLLSMALSVLGFGTVLTRSPYWIENFPLGVGLLIVVVVTPLYILRLLGERNVQTRNAESANEAKSQALFKVAHELMTPVSSLVGMTGLLGRTSLDSKQRDMVNLAADAARHLEALVRDIVDFAEFETGRVSQNSGVLGVRTEIALSTSWVEEAARRKGLSFGTYVSSEVPEFVEGDSRRLRQLLTNLIGNGIKHTEAGWVALTVDCRTASDGRLAIRFTVADSGPGIPTKELTKVFEPFVQGERAVLQGSGGLGLGTTISQEIVDHLGGILRIDSAMDRGTNVEVQLPFAPVLRAADRPELTHDRGARFLLLSNAPSSTNRAWLESMRPQFAEVRSIAANRNEFEGIELSAGKWVVILEIERVLDFQLIDEIASKLTNDSAFGLTGVGQVQAADAIELARRGVQFSVPAQCSMSRLRIAFGERVRDRARSAPSVLSAKVTRARRVLVAEDDDIGRFFAREVLEQAGFRVELVGDGTAALSRLLQGEFDLAILDMQLPGKNGLEILRAYRQHAGLEGAIPILMLTADARRDGMASCMQAGATDYLIKPINPEELERTVRRAASLR